MGSYVDIHLHLLPGLDDGPATERQSIEHAERLVRAGVREAVVTPHVGHASFAVPVEEIHARTRELQRALDFAGLDLELRPGGELHASAAATLPPWALEAIAQGPADAPWVLLEAPFAGLDDAFLDGCAHLRAHGYGVVVAHPERSAGFMPAGMAMLRRELEHGTALQVSVDSLLGHHGKEARAGAATLVWRDMPVVVASDGHGGRRIQTMRDGFEALVAAGASPWRAWQVTQVAPSRLLEEGVHALAQRPRLLGQRPRLLARAG